MTRQMCLHCPSGKHINVSYVGFISVRRQSEKKHREATTIDLLARIHHLETLHKESLDPAQLTDLTTLRRELATVLNSTYHRHGLRSKTFFFAHGDKSGRLMARMLRAHRSTTYITKIRDTHGKTQHLPNRILPTIRSYFMTLYELPTPVTDAGRKLHSQKIHAHLSQHVTRRLTPETAQLLDAPLTIEELSDVVKSSKTGKCPGPDGLPLQYYKRFAKILYPRFLVAFNAILEGHTIPSQTQAANISLIPKEGKDAERCDSCRPISLLNCDLKLYAKILATQLTPYVPGLIHQDQVGFVAGREARDNTIRALTIMHRAARKREGLLLLSTDAEKAFDRVNWEFLFATLSQVGLGPNLCTWIRALYSDPTTRVCVNGIYTEPFKIRNGTRQGCPLSPLLFVFALEPFLSSVRASPDIRGIRTGRTEHRVAAFADDHLFFVTHPETTLPNLLKAFEVYGTLSNLKINLAKSFLLNVSMPRSMAQSIRPNCSIQWAEDRIIYLGIWLTSDHTLMFRDNFAPMLATISTDLKAWNYPHISWLGHVQAIKMNVLPRILYLFQTIPIDLLQTFFRDLQTQISNYVWRGSRTETKIFHPYPTQITGGGACHPRFHNVPYGLPPSAYSGMGKTPQTQSVVGGGWLNKTKLGFPSLFSLGCLNYKGYAAYVT
uniref:Reverse transcriptase domain-containing protein n=1 Tax=Leptobrachium leishanense TaxID=445787 RepID=A0A8C5M8J3_9ANUR